MKTTHFMSKNASLDYDEKTQTLLITYEGKVSASTILRVHSWMREVVTHFGVNNIRGTVVDMRGVVMFPTDSMTTLQVTGSDGRRDYDFCAIPSAIIVRNAYQERLMSAVCETEHVAHFRMLHDMQSAKAFIMDYNTQNKSTGFFGIQALFGAQLSAARA
jgi:hypothetical protein